MEANVIKSGISKIKKTFSLFLILCLTSNITILFFQPVSAFSTISVPTDYSTIQQAINAASPGDIIEVAAGTYNEHLVISKPLTLKGDNRNSIIDEDGQQRIIDITTSNVEISGFTIRDGTKWRMGIHVDSWPSSPGGINISNNTLLDCYYGIYLSNCSNAIIKNNIIENSYYGIRLHSCQSSNVEGNIINNSGYYGLNLYSYSFNNQVINNEISDGKYGVLLEYSDNNLLEQNLITSNTEYGVRLSYSTGNIHKGNELSNNKYGIFLFESLGNSFYYNNIIENVYQVEHSNIVAPFDEANYWDDQNYPPGAKGNYWSNYLGLDNGVGLGRWNEGRYANDKIGDTQLPHENVDWYPLMVPWTPEPQFNPVAIFTVDPIEPITNLAVIFNASKSYDPDGDIVLYSWNFGDQTPTNNENDPVTEHVFISEGIFSVNLTITDDDGLTNSTSMLITVHPTLLEIDLYSQHPEPYSGKGLDEPCDAFEPQEIVVLNALVEYNHDPIENKLVTFYVTDPLGSSFLPRTASTTANGKAMVEFNLGSNPTFGIWNVLATVEVSENYANDTMNFEVGWILELLELETADLDGVSKTSFDKLDEININVQIKNIAFLSRSAYLAITIEDEVLQPIARALLDITVPPGVHDFDLIVNLKIPRWAFVGQAKVYGNLLNDKPKFGGTPVCPEISSSFYLWGI